MAVVAGVVDVAAVCVAPEMLTCWPEASLKGAGTVTPAYVSAGFEFVGKVSITATSCASHCAT